MYLDFGYMSVSMLIKAHSLFGQSGVIHRYKYNFYWICVSNFAEFVWFVIDEGNRKWIWYKSLFNMTVLQLSFTGRILCI